jgi:hypothetical protein
MARKLFLQLWRMTILAVVEAGVGAAVKALKGSKVVG